MYCVIVRVCAQLCERVCCARSHAFYTHAHGAGYAVDPCAPRSPVSVNFALCYYAGNSDTGYQPKNQPGYQLVSPYQLVTSIKAGYQLVNQAGSFVV